MFDDVADAGFEGGGQGEARGLLAGCGLLLALLQFRRRFPGEGGFLERLHGAGEGADFVLAVGKRDFDGQVAFGEAGHGALHRGQGAGDKRDGDDP